MIVLSPHNGHYLYNDKIYVDRASILDDMLLNKDYFGEVSFYYNDHVFDKFDWGIPVDISLDRLYTFRAQQLRDKYKKLILSFSGGTDSIQVLNTFLKNRIHLDEIVVAHHTELLKNVDRRELERDESLSSLLEYERTALPYLNRISPLLKNTKITHLDVSDYLVTNLMEQKFGHMGRSEEHTSELQSH